EAEGERVRGVAGHAEELADRRDVSLAIGAPEALRDVAREGGGEEGEARGKALVGLEPVDLTDGGERGLDGVDGGGLVPLGVEIGLRKIATQRAHAGFVGRRGGGGIRPGWVSRRLGLEIEGESYPNCQRHPLQKRPSARDEPGRVGASTTRIS